MKHLFLFSLLVFLPLHAYESIPVDFDVSMQMERYKNCIRYESGWRVLDFFRELYTRNDPSIQRPFGSSLGCIPHIVHHIWLGHLMPDQYQAYRKSWFANHHDWIFILWADNPLNFGQAHVVRSWHELEEAIVRHEYQFLVVDIHLLDFSTRSYFDVSNNYGERSDILRYEILYRMGGIYADCDVECIKPFNDLNERYDFYIGIQPLDTNMVQLGIGLIGTIPDHPIIKQAIDTIKDDQDKPQIVVRTGPIHFTKSFLCVAGHGKEIDVALPAGYFYPCGYEEQHQPQPEWLKPETYAIHWWAGSWMKPEAMVQINT